MFITDIDDTHWQMLWGKYYCHSISPDESEVLSKAAMLIYLSELSQTPLKLFYSWWTYMQRLSYTSFLPLYKQISPEPRKANYLI